jgi:hypothetical protein
VPAWLKPHVTIQIADELSTTIPAGQQPVAWRYVVSLAIAIDHRNTAASRCRADADGPHMDDLMDDLVSALRVTFLGFDPSSVGGI